MDKDLLEGMQNQIALIKSIEVELVEFSHFFYELVEKSIKAEGQKTENNDEN
ncbi:MAG: hypothetical protein WCG99_03505 [Candidatus Berkelbacteria bacterium]